MTSYFPGTGAWENSPLEQHKEYMEDERPRWPSLKNLYDAWFENPDNWDERQSVEIDTYLEDPIVILKDEYDDDEKVRPELKRCFEFTDNSGQNFGLEWWQHLTERQAEWLMKDPDSKLVRYSGEHDRVIDLAPSFRSYLKQYNPFYKPKPLIIKSASKVNEEE